MLTDRACRNAKPLDKPYRLLDGRGLYLEVRPSGAKSWRYRFQLRDGDTFKENMFAVGDYVIPPRVESDEESAARRAGGSFTLAEARLERDKARALVKQGINPVHGRRLERLKRQQAIATTFESVAKEWLALKDWEAATKKRRLDLLTRVVFPKIGELPVTMVTPVHILDILTTVAKHNGLTVAAEAKRTMSAVFELAVSTLRASTDPVYPVRRALPPNKTQHKRALSTDEIGMLLSDVSHHGGRYETITAFRLMWWTLCRPSEAAEACWAEFDLAKAIWRLPPERMKKRVAHVTPLPTQAVQALKTQQLLTGDHRHVFPGRDNRDGPMSMASFRQMLYTLGWSGKYSPHATRTTGSTRLNELGYRGDWIERQLAHSEVNLVRRTYNHADYFVDRALMMQAWADMLESWQQSASNTGKSLHDSSMPS